MTERRSLTIRNMFQAGDYVVQENVSGGWKVRGWTREVLGRWFSLRFLGPNRWEVSRGDSRNGRKRIRSRLLAVDLHDAVQKAADMVYGVSATASNQMHTVDEVLDGWIKSRTRTANEETVRDYKGYILEFLRFLDTTSVRLWKEMSPSILEAFVDHCRDRKLSHGTIRLRLVPVKGASKWASQKWGYPHFSSGFRLEGLGKASTPRIHWPIAHVASFLTWLRSRPNSHNVLPGFALQGLCGLRVREALRLKWEDVDLRSGVICIQDAKNRSSNREIPIPALVRSILESVADDSGPVVSGLPAASAEVSYSKQWRDLSREWKRSLPSIPCKDLRNTLLTESNLRGWYSVALEMYVGHTVPELVLDITAKHYLAAKTGAMRQVFRRQVVSKIDEATSKWTEMWRANGEVGNVIPLKSPRQGVA